MDSINPLPQLTIDDLNTLHEDLIKTQRTVMICTICIVVAFVVILPPILYIYFRKIEKGIWLLKEQNTNLLDYYENIPDKECSAKKSIV
jgi:hypothetical protein